jgi:hypothetical protein
MTGEQQHHIRNALLCLRRAIQTRDWTLVEEQVARIDRVVRPSCEARENTLTCLLLELRLLAGELTGANGRVARIVQLVEELADV